MSGAPAFQGNAFQGTAFQSGVMLVGANYAVGSPSFATPTVGYKYVFNASAYSLASPSFARPTMSTAAGISNLHANPYSIGSLSFALPGIRYYQTLIANVYSVGSPAFSRPPPSQNYHLFTNAANLSGLSFSAPILSRNFQLLQASYSLSSPIFAQNVVIQINTTLTISIDGYSLGHPSFGFPRFQEYRVGPIFPVTYFTQAEEAASIVKTLMNYLLHSIPSGVDPTTNNARRLASTLRDHAEEAVRGMTLGDQLREVIAAVDQAGAMYDGVEAARVYLMGQSASMSLMTQVVFRSALVMVLGLECSIIGRTTLTNQEQCQNVIRHVRQMFEEARAIGIDEIDVLVYQTLTALGGATIKFLASQELKLPFFVTWQSRMPMPSLYLSNRIYGDAKYSDEIETENDVVHPAFCPRDLRVLSHG